MSVAGKTPWVWMGTPEVAEYLGIALRSVYKLIDTGELPAYQIGRVVARGLKAIRLL